MTIGRVTEVSLSVASRALRRAHLSAVGTFHPQDRVQRNALVRLLSLSSAANGQIVHHQGRSTND